MTTWFILALSAPILWAFNVVTDTAVRRQFIKNDWTLTWLTAALHALAVIPFFLFIDIGFESPLVAIEMTIVGTLWTIPFLIYYRSLEFEEASRVSLFSQMLPIWNLLLAFILLGESLPALQLFAFVILLIAGSLAAIKRVEGFLRFSKAFWLILLACLLWALSDVLFKILEPGFNHFYSAFTFFLLGSSIPAILMLFSSKLRKSIKTSVPKLSLRGWLLFLSGQILGITGSLFFAQAIVMGSIALTSVLIGIQPLFVLLFGILLRFFFHEIPKEQLTKPILLLKGTSFLLVLLGLFLLQI